MSLGDSDKVAFLARLAHEITIAARFTYTLQTDSLENANLLRTINEVQHRVLSCLLEVINKQSSIEFQRSIADFVLLQANVEVREHLSWAWHSAKNNLNPLQPSLTRRSSGTGQKAVDPSTSFLEEAKKFVQRFKP